MGKKKRKREEEQRPWCYYCDRTFTDETTLIVHQKARHFKCTTCHKKMATAPSLAIHCSHVHKQALQKVPNAKPGQDSLELEIFGMAGVPDGALPGEDARGGDELLAGPQAAPPVAIPPSLPPASLPPPMYQGVHHSGQRAPGWLVYPNNAGQASQISYQNISNIPQQHSGPLPNPAMLPHGLPPPEINQNQFVVRPPATVLQMHMPSGPMAFDGVAQPLFPIGRHPPGPSASETQGELMKHANMKQQIQERQENELPPSDAKLVWLDPAVSMEEKRASLPRYTVSTAQR